MHKLKDVNQTHMLQLSDALFAQLGLTAKIIVKKFGNEGREAIKEAWEEFSDIHAKSLNAMGMVPMMNIEEFAKWLVQFHGRVGAEAKIKKVKTNTISVHVTNCFRSKIFRIVGAPKEMCNWLAVPDKALCKVANPKMTIDLVKNIHQGDPYCEYIIKTER
jgi:predicted ArsR family transcriptional regulator